MLLRTKILHQMHLTYINITSLSINHINNISATLHKETTTHDIHGSPPVWGYVHQLFVFFIIFFQSSYMHRATKPTPHRTRDLCASYQILLPELGHNTKPSYIVCTQASYNHLHLALQVLTHSMHKASSSVLSHKHPLLLSYIT